MIVRSNKDNLWNTHMDFWLCEFNFYEKWVFLSLTFSNMSKPHTITVSLMSPIILRVGVQFEALNCNDLYIT